MDRKRKYFGERPPRMAAWMLRLMLRGERGESVCGDLEEEWREQIRRGGKRAARKWFWRCAWQSIAGTRAVAPMTEDALQRKRDRGGFMENILQDVRYALRGLRKSPGFTLVAILTLAIGIGANTAIFTVVEAALLRALPYRDSSRVVHLFETQKQSGPGQFSYLDYTDVRAGAKSFENVAAYGFFRASYGGAEGSEILSGGRVSANFFPTLGVEPVLGRGFSPEEDQVGRERGVVLLTHRLWQRKFGGDPKVIGQTVRLSGSPLTIIGVLPANFHFARLGDPEMFVTLSPPQNLAGRRFTHFMWTIARLREGVTLEQAKGELQFLARQREQVDTRWHKDTGIDAVPIREAISGSIEPLLKGLLAAVGAVLLIACANVANMLLARATGRQREVGIRVALGASRGRLVRQFLTESLLLSLLGGAIGLLWAGWGVRAMLAVVPAARMQAFPFLKNLEIHSGVLGFTFALCLVTGVVFGLAPSLRASSQVAERLKEGGRGSTARKRLGQAFVVAEVALALVLVTVAGLLTRSLMQLIHVNPGFDTANLLIVGVNAPPARYDNDAKVEAYWRQVTGRIESLPGVKGVAKIDRLPLVGSGNTGTPSMVGRPAATQSTPSAQLRSISINYFQVMGIPLLTGRNFAETDRAESPLVIMVNKQLADDIFPGEELLGKRVTFAFTPGRDFEIVGVVDNENVTDLDARTKPVLYFPESQGWSTSMNLLVRTLNDPQGIVQAARTEIHAVNPETTISGVITMENLIGNSTPVFMRRYPLMLIGAFAGVALLLAAIGIYGVMAYAVSQRSQEIGIRMAVGARPADVFLLVLKEGFVLATVGVAAGLLASMAVTKFVAAFLFRTATTDALSFSASALTLTLVALLACYLPARRAAGVDPLVALRHE